MCHGRYPITDDVQQERQERPTAAVFHHIPGSGTVDCDEGQGHRGGLDQHAREALAVERRKHEDVRQGEQVLHVIAGPEPGDGVGDIAQLSRGQGVQAVRIRGSGQEKARMGLLPSHGARGGRELEDPFRAHHAGDHRHHEPVAGQSEPGPALRGPVTGGRWREHVGAHAGARDDRGPLAWASACAITVSIPRSRYRH